MSSLVVDTNLSALQAINDLNSTDTNMTTAIKRLSSGLKIQTAATGPAQYVISQALESQSNGYNTAIANAQDGVSLIQTASGALSQISSILQTMDQLALTSSNGATQTKTSLAANQAEFTDLQKSIDEIAKTTTFGQTQLLTGTTNTPTTAYTGTLQVGAFDLSDQQITMSISAVTSASLHLAGTAGTVTGTGVTGGKATLTAAKTLVLQVGGATGPKYTIHLGIGTHTLATVATKINEAAPGVLSASVVQTTTTPAKSHLVISTVATGTTAKVDVTAALATFGLTAGTHAGTGTAVSISSVATAEKAVTAIQKALTTVDKVASSVGATQNELQAIVSNLTVGQQNLQAADSQLVDVNMAQEMTTFSTDQILMQTGVAMLAQAQQAPSLVEKLI